MSTVLVLQADPALVDVWRVALESSGHDVLASFSAASCAAHARDGGVDVIVVDADRAELDILLARLDRLPDIPPLVLVSDSPEAPDLSAHIGAAAFLPKPCSPGELDAVVTRVAGHAPLGDITDEPTRPRRVPE